VHTFIATTGQKTLAAGRSSAAAPPQNLHLSDAYWSVAPEIGASVGNGRFKLSYWHYFMSINGNHRKTPPIWNNADAFEVNVKF
jgi:hypothetical protein